MAENVNAYAIPEVGKDFEVVPVSAAMDITSNGYTKLDTSGDGMATISSCLQYYFLNDTANAVRDTLDGAYVVKFPEGVPHTLMKLKDDGFSSAVIGPNGKIKATASFHKIEEYSNVLDSLNLLNMFSVMSLATSQYFMAEINSKLEVINTKLDAILDFLVTEQNSELISEISFVRYAYKNFSYIVKHDNQCQATIASIQAAKKTAIKQIEFYMAQLTKDAQNVGKGSNSFATVKQWEDFNNKLGLAQQLYIISNTLEVFYSQNFDKEYLQMMQSDVADYLDKCRMRELRILPAVEKTLNGRQLVDAKEKKQLATEIAKKLDVLEAEKEPEMVTSFKSILDSATHPAEYYIKPNGEVYLKTA